METAKDITNESDSAKESKKSADKLNQDDLPISKDLNEKPIPPDHFNSSMKQEFLPPCHNNEHDSQSRGLFVNALQNSQAAQLDENLVRNSGMNGSFCETSLKGSESGNLINTKQSKIESELLWYNYVYFILK